MLDLECFSYLNRGLESPLAPVVIFATNRGICEIRGTDGVKGPHGMPVDLLDRILIVRTSPYTLHEMIHIISIRAATEGVKLSEESLALLGEIGVRASLRYALQLLTPASILAAQGSSQNETVQKKHVEESDFIFYDAKTSAQMLIKHEADFLM